MSHQRQTPTSKMIYLRISCTPVPASRPRVTRWGTFYGKRHNACRSETLALFKEMRDNGSLPLVPLSGRLVVWCYFQVVRPKTTKLVTPRGDIDNYTKLLFDCCSKHIWDDDVQVDIMSARKGWADTTGRTDVWIKELNR